MESEVQRPLADFPVNIWEDILNSFSKSELGSDSLKEKHITLKETVNESFTASRANPIENIMFIDTLCCINWYVFKNFEDEDGKFKAHLVADARGMLSLYEAAQWRIPGEDILDEALAFSNSQLEEISSRSSPHLAIPIKKALKHPFHKGISRIETRQYISYYEAEEKCDATLLEFAKIDFNLLQMLHRQELACVTRWHKEMEFESKITYTRHIVAEAYLWALGTYFEPEYSQARVALAIIVILYTALDDVYDAYGTKEELEIFTHALEKWLPEAPTGIPDSMKHFYRVIVDFYEKLSMILRRKGGQAVASILRNH
ncbi:unnamed protein product [Brassica oleracea]